MGTDAYLRKLDLDQLRYCRDRANELIDEKEREKKRVVWSIEDRDVRLATYADTEYLKAAERLLEEARNNAVHPQHPRLMELHLVAIFVPESEYSDWVTPGP